jgi:hypothetical protein
MSSRKQLTYALFHPLLHLIYNKRHMQVELDLNAVLLFCQSKACCFSKLGTPFLLAGLRDGFQACLCRGVAAWCLPAGMC